ncbi:MAG: hypothetical protein LQ349_009088, partial [Xanthoria aureola]
PRDKIDPYHHDVNSSSPLNTSQSYRLEASPDPFMALPRLLQGSVRSISGVTRPFSTAFPRFQPNEREHDTQPEWRESQKSKPTGPHMTNTNSTIANEMPSVGADKAPPELLTSVDPHFVPKDSVPENTERMTGGTQKGAPESGVNSELEVGQMEGAKFKVEPLRRTGEDDNTMRASISTDILSISIDQSRKRGTLESDLLLSTFADTNLPRMTTRQLQQYDVFLDENDWDIYYWATQEPTPTSRETAEGGNPDSSTPAAQGKAMDQSETDAWRKGAPRSGEWAQTVGTFKPAYRPVPQRWKNSEILSMLRKHVLHRSAGGVHEDSSAQVEGKGLAQSVQGTGGGGLAAFPYDWEDKDFEFSAQILEEPFSEFFDQYLTHTASTEANEFDYPDLFTDGETLTDSTSNASSHARFNASEEQCQRSLSKTAFLPQNYQNHHRREKLQPAVSGLELLLDIEGQANRRPQAADPPHSAPATITTLPLRRKPRLRTTKTSTHPTKSFHPGNGHLETMHGPVYNYKHESPHAQEWTHGLEQLSLHSETSHFSLPPSTNVASHLQNGSASAFHTPRHMTLRDEFFHGEGIGDQSFRANTSVDLTEPSHDEHFDPFQTQDSNLDLAPHQIHPSPSWGPPVSASSEATYMLSTNHALPDCVDSYYTNGLASKSAPALPYQLSTQFSIESFGAPDDSTGPLIDGHLPTDPLPPAQNTLHSYPDPPAIPANPPPAPSPSHSPPRGISSPSLPPTPSRAHHHHRRSKSSAPPRRKSASTLRAPKSNGSMSMGFVNFTPHDSKRILTGVAPSGSSKTKARREQEANEKKRKLSAA